MSNGDKKFHEMFTECEHYYYHIELWKQNEYIKLRRRKTLHDRHAYTFLLKIVFQVFDYESAITDNTSLDYLSINGTQ